MSTDLSGEDLYVLTTLNLLLRELERINRLLKAWIKLTVNMSLPVLNGMLDISILARE